MPTNLDDMMMPAECYSTLEGETIEFASLDFHERELLQSVIFRADEAEKWQEFAAYYMKVIGDYYLNRGFTRNQIVTLPLWKIARDLKERLFPVSTGRKRTLPDYRDELSKLIRNFPTRRAFCDATGLSDEMVGNVLAKKHHLSIDALSGALDRIGFRLQIVPVAKA